MIHDQRNVKLTENSSVQGVHQFRCLKAAAKLTSRTPCYTKIRQWTKSKKNITSM